MARRPPPTLADYLTLAVSPMLIMALVGSLVFFLLEVCYQGAFPGRLQWILGCFVVAAVLIGRIAIEWGGQRAALFAIPLGAITYLAIAKYVTLADVGLARYSGLINALLLGIVWWCAHKLTWNCTFVDESQEAPEEGLLQTIGLDNNPHAPSDASPDPHAARNPARLPATGRQSGRRAAPGLWVVYFSLGALPAFALGQWMLPEGRASRAGYVFALLLVYVASALGLLMTTSFLGLRRYLRRRRLQMPPHIAAGWVAAGSAVALGVLLAALLIPRPRAEIALSELPPLFTSRPLQADRTGTGDDGAASRQRQRATAQHGQQPQHAGGRGADASRTPQSAGHPQQRDGTSDDGSMPSENPPEHQPWPHGSGSSRSEQPRRVDGASPSSASDIDSAARANSASGGQSTSGGAGASQGSAAEGSASQGSSTSASSDPAGGAQQRGGASSRNSDSGQAQRADFPPSEARGGSGSSQSARQPAFDWTALAKLLLYLVVGCTLLYAAWRHRQAIVEQWRAFWQALWPRRRRDDAADASQPAGGQRRAAAFRDFVDPFSSRLAEQWPAATLVQYAFAALEAWARDHGTPRPECETPLEFAQRLGQMHPLAAAGAASLAQWYTQAAYAPGKLDAVRPQEIAELWSYLRATAATPAQAVGATAM
jgi:hypothetical protein